MSTFSELLRRHIRDGDWTLDDFADEVAEKVEKRPGDRKITEALVRYWPHGNLPNERQFGAIERLLFGPPPEDRKLQERRELRQAYEAFPWWRHVLKARDESIGNIFDRVCGLWEMYHYGFSQRNAQKKVNPELSVSLLDIYRVNRREKNIIDFRCTSYDDKQRTLFSYDGHIIAVHETLYLFSEDSTAGNEIVFCVIYLPSAQQNILYGVIAGVAGYGYRGRDHTPSAARLALRRLGQPRSRPNVAKAAWEEICSRCVKNLTDDFQTRDWADSDAVTNMREALEAKIGGYIDYKRLELQEFNKSDNVREEIRTIAERISNVISPDQIPFVLQMACEGP